MLKSLQNSRAEKIWMPAAEILEAYVGQYIYDETPPERIWTVTREGGKLFIDIPKKHKTELFAESESKFFLKIGLIQLTFVKTEGQVTRIEFVTRDEKFNARKMK